MCGVVFSIIVLQKVCYLFADNKSANGHPYSAAIEGNNNALFDAISGLPFMVADGLLVRSLCCKFDLFSHSIDMAVLQDMG